jgi:ribosome maturation protein SDO1
MTNTTARIKAKGKNFEIIVDVDKALEFKKQNAGIQEALEIDTIFTDSKKGMRASEEDLRECFQTDNNTEIAEKILKNGEILLPIEYRKKQQEGKIKQVVDFFVRNAVEPNSGRPYTESRIQSAIEQAGVKIENKPVSEQLNKIISEIRKVIPIKIESKKLKITVPAIHTGKVYGLLNLYKEKEEWLNNGDLECVISLPVGLQSEFYDKLNGITHGSAITEEIK